MRAKLVAIAVVSALALACSVATATAASNSWSSLAGLAAANGAGWVRVYAIENQLTAYAGTEGGGVFRTTDGGLTWAPLNRGLTGVSGALVVRALALGGGGPYAGTQAGLFKLSGATWTPLAQGAEPNPAQPSKLNAWVQAILPAGGGKLLAGTFGGGVYRSGDDGATWTPPAPGNGMPRGETVWSLTAVTPSLTLAATSDGIFRSTDGGATWALANDGISGTTLRVLADGQNPLVYYAATAGDGVFRSLDAGVTWSAANGSGSDALLNGTVRDMVQLFSATRTRLYVATGDGLWVGTTGNGPAPGPIQWRKATQTGLAGNTIFWALSGFLTTPGLGTLLAGTQSNGGYGITFTQLFNTVVPAVSDTTPSVGQTLTATPGTWSGSPPVFAFAWQRCTSTVPSSCASINGATGSSYVVQPADQGVRLRVVVTAENDYPMLTAPTAESAITNLVGAKVGPLPGENQSATASIATLPPGDAALPQSGDTLHAQGWLFNPAATSTAFQWLRCNAAGVACQPIAGATRQDHVLADEDVGSRLCVSVIGTNASGSTALACSGLSNTIFPQQATNLVPPSLGGVAAVGETLVGNVGSWKYPGTTYVRQWEQCAADGGSCATISGARAPTYVVRSDDVGHRIRLRVTADSNGPSTFPPPVDAVTQPSAVVPAPGGGGGGGGGGAGGGAGGGDAGGGSSGDVTKPLLSELAVGSKRVRRGGALTLRYRLSEAARLSLKLERSIAGRKAPGKPCKAGARRGRRCRRWQPARTLVVAGRKGAGRAAVVLKVRGAALPVGSYRAIVTPIDAAGNRGRTGTATFAVVRR